MAPGKVEDAKGVPFVGPAGTLLRNELRRIGLDPRDAYYMNAVCCAPPNNRVEATHLTACRQNLKDQLDVAKASWILACGNIAIESLIPHAGPHTRGKKISIHGHNVFGVYHPSYILRAKDRGLYLDWRDSLQMFKLMMAGIDILLDTRCMYCGSNKTALKVPVCSKCIGKWKIDSRWRYMPPPQIQMEFT